MYSTPILNEGYLYACKCKWNWVRDAQWSEQNELRSENILKKIWINEFWLKKTNAGSSRPACIV